MAPDTKRATVVGVAAPVRTYNASLVMPWSRRRVEPAGDTGPSLPRAMKDALGEQAVAAVPLFQGTFLHSTQSNPFGER